MKATTENLDLYRNKYLQAIKANTDDDELLIIIDCIYVDGFEDGYDEGSAKEST